MAAQRLRLLPGPGAGLRRPLPRRDWTGGGRGTRITTGPRECLAPGIAQGAGEARRLRLRAGEVAAERGRGGACEARAASPLARLAGHLKAGGLLPFCAKL